MQEITDPSSCVTSNATDRDQNLAEFAAHLLSQSLRAENGCLLWTGGMDLGTGYGSARRPGGASTRTHRLIYELVRGPIPDGLHIDHTCHNEQMWCAGGSGCLHRRCINPDHLEAVTPVENLRRGRHGQRGPNRNQILRGVCKNGHPMEGENVRMSARGRRECRTCDRERDLRRRSDRTTSAPKRDACPRGHLLTEDNLHRQGSIVRCLACRIESANRQRKTKAPVNGGIA